MDTQKSNAANKRFKPHKTTNKNIMTCLPLTLMSRFSCLGMAIPTPSVPDSNSAAALSAHSRTQVKLRKKACLYEAKTAFTTFSLRQHTRSPIPLFIAFIKIIMAHAA